MDKTLLRQRARELRKNSTDVERKLWYYLRANRLGYKFKRQVPISCFIVDFICIEKRLIIELDGVQHQENYKYDNQRTAKLNQLGYEVLRFWNNEVVQNISGVIDVILNTLSPTLSRKQERG